MSMPEPETSESAMIRLESDADYCERLCELMALEEIADLSVDLVERARQYGALRADLGGPIEAFAEAVIQSLDAILGRHLVVRRDATKLYEDMMAARNSASVRNRQASRASVWDTRKETSASRTQTNSHATERQVSIRGGTQA